MSDQAMFEKATRRKLRFDTPKGSVTTEDLWDLPLTGNGANLDDIAIALQSKVETAQKTSFVKKVLPSSSVDQLKFEIVKYVITVRLAEAELAAQAADRKAMKQKLHGILAQKQDERLLASSAEDIQKMIDAL